MRIAGVFSDDVVPPQNESWLPPPSYPVALNENSGSHEQKVALAKIISNLKKVSVDIKQKQIPGPKKKNAVAAIDPYTYFVMNVDLSRVTNKSSGRSGSYSVPELRGISRSLNITVDSRAVKKVYVAAIHEWARENADAIDSARKALASN